MPSAISKAISSAPIVDRENVAKGYLKASAKVLSVVGLIGTLLLAVFSYPISLLQGNKGAFLGYIFLSPAVFFVSLISCFRGYFQGLIRMNYISRSQVIEQVIKLVLGLVLSYLFMPNVLLAVAGATLGVTVSEVVCLIYLYLVYKKHKNQIGIVKDKVKVDNKMIKKLIKLSIPLTAVSLMIPLSHFIDSFLVVNILKTYRQDATSLYGISSGAVHTVIGLPVAICYAFAVITLPSVSQTRNDCDKNAKINQSVLITGIISLFASILCFVFANQIISLLFNSFTVKVLNVKPVASSLLPTSTIVSVSLQPARSQVAVFVPSALSVALLSLI
jgi:stage V sporulation protein B